MTKEIVYSGGDKDGPSMLRMKVEDGWYIAIFHANGVWYSVSVPEKLQARHEP